ncbi:hypothetical protein [Paraglaciecola sp. 2405UD69-4]|uniref:hypothetical protein n=1 Tax=Paraglaciecola sp. 2405UD69-4 TaxID=3391836 RepID=UPI0039C980FB
MLTQKLSGIVLFSSMLSLGGITLSASASNDDGCWNGRHSKGPCLEYGSYEQNNKTYIILSNVCNERLYVKWCADLKCGSDHIRGGEQKKKYEFVTDAYISVKAIGSKKAKQDWVCSSKVPGWHYKNS